MNNDLTTESTPGIPGWAFLLACYNIIAGIGMLLQSSFMAITYGSEESWLHDWGRNIEFAFCAWLFFQSIMLFMVAFIVLKRRQYWKKAVQLVAVLSILQSTALIILAISDWSDSTPFFWLSVAYTIASLIPGIVIPLMFIWLTFRLDSFHHPDIAMTLLFLLTQCLATCFISLAGIVFVLVTLFTGSTPGYMIFLVAPHIVVLLYSILLAICALAIHRHPLAIQKVKILFWILGTLITAGLLLALVYAYSQSSSNSPQGMYDVYNLFLNFLNYPVPLFVVIWMANRYGPSFAIAENYKFGLNNCPHCGYNLTGNTSGQCPECGTWSTKELLPAIMAENDE